MPLTPQQKLDLLASAREKWITAESSLYAYERGIKIAKSRSDLLKILTILSALLTAASGIINIQWLTIAAGLLTTALATIEKLYTPAENFQKYWANRSGLESAKQDLTTYAITLEEMQGLVEASKPLDQISQQISTLTQQMPRLPEAEEKERAQNNFNLTLIAQIINRLQEASGVAVSAEIESELELPEDAPDIVPVYRPQS